MKKVLFFLVAVCLLSCNSNKDTTISNEDKIANLIKDDMFKTLYDFESYQSIETSKIDSAYTTIYQDSIIRANGKFLVAITEIMEEINNTKLVEIQATIAAWGDNYSDYARNKVSQAQEEYYNLLVKVAGYAELVLYAQNEIIEAYNNFTPRFIGWTVTHKFRCKTKGGTFDLGKYKYVFDENFEKIIYSEDTESKQNEKINHMIDEIIDFGIKKKQEEEIIQK